MIEVMKTKLPKLGHYKKYLKKIWKTNQVTNDGPLVRELEGKLREYWGVKHVVCVSSGTMAIMIALGVLGVKKEIYVSPLSFVATVSAPLWMGIKPKFFDVGEEPNSPAIVTHTYGIPNLVNAWPVIYDASHAFAVKYQNCPLVTFGDISIISFHATKLFHTVEGGAIVTQNDTLAKKARLMLNFGFKDRYAFEGIGINGKMSEFHAAMGLCNLEDIGKVVLRYRQMVKRYDDGLGLSRKNTSYYPVVYPSENALKKAIKRMNENDIYPRRYFYPPLNKVFGGRKCPLGEEISNRVLCLPLYWGLKDKEIDKIIKLV